MDIKKPISRRDQAEEMKIHIMNTALSVFASKGYSKTSIKDLAKEAKISQGLMYHYFHNKEALLMATVEYHSFLPQLRQILKDKKESQFREVFIELATKFLTLLDKKARLIDILFQEKQTNPEIKKVWSKLIQEGMSLLKKFIKSRIDSGEIRDINIEATAFSMFSAIVMFHYTNDVFTASKATGEFIEALVDNLLSGIKVGR